jgi:hypothetical protein
VYCTHSWPEMGRKENENTLSVISQYLTLQGNSSGFYYETVDLGNDVIFVKTFISFHVHGSVHHQ